MNSPAWDPTFSIAGRQIGDGFPTYFIAELSCNHNQDIELALELIRQAAAAGADAIKIQTYTPDTITLNCRNDYFRIKGTIWDGEYMWDLYNRAYTPWAWFPRLKEEVDKFGLQLFSSPFDVTAVDFLEFHQVPAYKIASFEIIDHILLKRIAQTGKPVIMSTGMASLSEIEEAVNVLRSNGCRSLAILKCTSAYPAEPRDANLANIPHLRATFNVVPGLSDHTLGIEVPVVSVVLGARIIEKHFTLSRTSGSPDDPFSLLPSEFKLMVETIRRTEQTIGQITYGGVQSEASTRLLRRSLFVVEDVKKGEPLTSRNVRSIRPGDGLHTKFYDSIVGSGSGSGSGGKVARHDIPRGTPLSWDLFE